MSAIYFLYSAMGCIALFGFLHIFFDDRFMNFKGSSSVNVGRCI